MKNLHTADKVVKGRNYVPDNNRENNGNSILTIKQVNLFREMHAKGNSIASIARKVSLSYACVYGAVTGDRWGLNSNYKKRTGNYKGRPR